MPTIEFKVEGSVPPKKRKKMWSKPGLQRDRLIALREAADDARKKTFKDEEEQPRPLSGPVHLTLHVHIGSEEVRTEGKDGPGDLDNFISGVCDGLQAPKNVPEEKLEPFKCVGAIAFGDDSQVIGVVATKSAAKPSKNEEERPEEASWFWVRVVGE